MDKSLDRKCLELALEENELDMFLTGRELYSLGYNPYEPGNSMISLNSSMAEIYRYYIDEPEKRVDLELEKTLLYWLTWKSGIGVFAVFSVLGYQLKMEQDNESPFKIDKDKIITALKEAIDIYEDKLKKKKYI